MTPLFFISIWYRKTSQYLRYVDLLNKQHGFWMNSICRSQIEKKIVVKNWSIFAEIVVKDLLSWWFVRNADYFDVDQTFWAWLGRIENHKNELDHVIERLQSAKRLSIFVPSACFVNTGHFHIQSPAQYFKVESTKLEPFWPWH